MSSRNVTVLDYGSGNIRSAVRALEHVGANVTLSSKSSDVLEADGLLVPGVGAFAAVMQGLKEVDALRMIGRRVAGGRPVMGICVGLQVLFDEGVEHGVRTPGMGSGPASWNASTPRWCRTWAGIPSSRRKAPAFAGIEDERFYFVHSYGVQKWDFDVTQPAMRAPQVTWAEHGSRFVAAVENGALTATQFHPEKSGDAGAALLENWLKTLG
ncbi:imidazole glycerol phosphate synthase subunit HisH [Arthrobacter sp. ATA002]|uniref:imidazole glycerol phosphate synthase subunit HisH n=1 Tax=Arthrobacter sp. ATA002 TaxID=2991715 RepID=UPI0022A68974|nr:imidazole glycerol phosphate synthase subunit HisH [Arthrobacter sp. ATA002]WAP51005.1 imidazole glycerol phosphate synthase subunit HisH [Arthrobacter sp. ATA002]